jgi:hypothetical protein
MAILKACPMIIALGYVKRVGIVQKDPPAQGERDHYSICTKSSALLTTVYGSQRGSMWRRTSVLSTRYTLHLKRKIASSSVIKVDNVSSSRSQEAQAHKRYSLATIQVQNGNRAGQDGIEKNRQTMSVTSCLLSIKQ